MNGEPSTTTIQSVEARLIASREAGLAWLLSRIGDGGEPADASKGNSWYRLPWTLAVANRREDGAEVLSWIERHALTAEGDLRPGPAQIPWITEEASYPLANLAIGAWYLERFDTALAIMRTLGNYQDADTGGAFLERPEKRVHGRQGLMCTAQLGMTALATGHRDVADGVFRWVKRLYEAQPDLPRRLYVSWDRSGLFTEFPPELAFRSVVDFDRPRQSYFNSGIGAMFMARYFMQTGSEEARAIGRALLQLNENGTDAQYDYPDTVHVGKFGWGAAAMLDIEPSERHLDDVNRMGRWYVDTQLPDGRWNPSGFICPEPTEGDGLWKTAEHVLVMSYVLASLGSYPRPNTGTDGARR
jgi:hypothetical protein